MARLNKISHFGNRLLEQKIPESKILPGMLLSFEYGKPGVYDRRPFLLVMGVINNNLEGVNLNYLKESEIQKFFTIASNIGIEPAYENYLRLPEKYIRLMMNTKYTPNRWDGPTVYKMIFKRYKRFREAYRSYNLKDVTAAKVVNYKVHQFVDKEGGVGESAET